MASHRQQPLLCAGHSRPVVDLNFSNVTVDGWFLISASKDGKPMLREGITGDWIGTFEGHKGCVWSAQLNRGATRAVTGSADFVAILWDAISGNVLNKMEHKHIVRCVQFDYSGDRIVTGGNEKLLRVFDVETAEPVVVLKGHKGNISSALWTSEDPNTILSGSASSQELRVGWRRMNSLLWDVRQGSVVRELEAKGTLGSLELSWDLSRITSVQGKHIVMYTAKSMDVLVEHQVEGDMEAASLSPDNQTLVVGGADFYVHKLDAVTGKEKDVFHGHHGPIHCVKYSPDGKMYASGSEDGTIRLWQHTPGEVYGLWRSPEEREEKTQ